jgi:uncharacterized protein YndB with AHSA1/START domain
VQSPSAATALPPSGLGSTGVERLTVELHKSAHIPASAQEVWSLVVDWAGMLRWWLAAEDGGLRGPTLVKCELVVRHVHRNWDRRRRDEP